MDTITSIDKLIYILENCEKEDYPTIPKNLDIPAEKFREFAYFSDEEYTRNCIAKNKDFELLLLCWNPDQETPIHCHDSQECWVVMIDGQLEEEKFEYNKKEKVPEKTEESELNDSVISYMTDDLGYHLLRNPKRKRAMSLHLYVNPINKCSTICPETGKVEWVKTCYHTYKGELVE
jgi:cysteine dioxygenase